MAEERRDDSERREDSEEEEKWETSDWSSERVELDIRDELSERLADSEKRLGKREDSERLEDSEDSDLERRSEERARLELSDRKLGVEAREETRDFRADSVDSRLEDSERLELQKEEPEPEEEERETDSEREERARWVVSERWLEEEEREETRERIADWVDSDFPDSDLDFPDSDLEDWERLEMRLFRADSVWEDRRREDSERWEEEPEEEEEREDTSDLMADSV